MQALPPSRPQLAAASVRFQKCRAASLRLAAAWGARPQRDLSVAIPVATALQRIVCRVPAGTGFHSDPDLSKPYRGLFRGTLVSGGRPFAQLLVVFSGAPGLSAIGI
jgi:hypothetical protein